MLNVPYHFCGMFPKYKSQSVYDIALIKKKKYKT